MENQNTEITEKNGYTLIDIFSIIMKNWYIILLTVILFTAIGYTYTKLRKPVYNVTYNTSYVASSLNSEGTGVTTITDTNVTIAYYFTVIDFCKQSVVIDRANFYYKEFEASGKEFDFDMDVFIQRVKNGEYTYPGYNTYGNSDILSSKVSTTIKDRDEEDYCILVSYEDSTVSAATLKVRLIILASHMEANEQETPNMTKYFGSYKVTIKDMGLNSTATNVSNNTTRIIFVLVGIVVSAIIIYLRYALDRTIKTKSELEKITGTTLLAYINDQEKE